LKIPKVDYVLTNPPWNQKGYSKEVLENSKNSNMYKYGLPPSSSADWAWIQLVLYLTEKKSAVILDQGALFRSGSESIIRKKKCYNINT
jgi:type I restriction enzyme M protein